MISALEISLKKLNTIFEKKILTSKTVNLSHLTLVNVKKCQIITGIHKNGTKLKFL